jgi:predicted GNAT family acetyltransferase
VDSTPTQGAAADSLLDNPVWHALNGPLARFAQETPGAVVRFDPEVSIFSAVDRLDAAAWAEQAESVGRGGFCAMFRDRIPTPPAGWQEQFRGPCFQMVAHDLAPRPDVDVVRLGADDAADMLALTQLTEPGPFFARTWELGRYIGVRRDGQLVAMAGERFRVPGFTEVSAVCTHPSVRGEGLGGALTLEIAHGIRARGDEAFLHLLKTNEPALSLYQKLGFRKRREIDVVAAQWHDDGLPADAEREASDTSEVEHLPSAGRVR